MIWWGGLTAARCDGRCTGGAPWPVYLLVASNPMQPVRLISIHLIAHLPGHRGGVVLRNIDLDQTGFREALLVDGPSSVHPLVQGCKLRCSGDDAVNIGGSGGCKWHGGSGGDG